MKKLTLMLALLLGGMTTAMAQTLDESKRVSFESVQVSSWCNDGTVNSKAVGPADKLCDGDLETYWHSNWEASTTEKGDQHDKNTQNGSLTNIPEYFVIDLGELRLISGFGYVPRPITSDGWSSGQAKALDIYVSETPFENVFTNATNANKTASVNSLSNDDLVLSETSITWEQVAAGVTTESEHQMVVEATGRYVMVVFKSTYGATADTGRDDVYANCAEFYVYSDNVFEYTAKYNITTSTGEVKTIATTGTAQVGETIECVAPAFTKLAESEASSQTATVGVTEYIFNMVEDLPFTVSASTSDFKWQNVYSGLNKDGDWATGKPSHWKLDSDSKITFDNGGGEDEQLWAFVGNIVDGFKIYNKSTGAEQTLSKATGNDVEAQMNATGENNVFKVAESDNTEGRTDGVSFYREGDLNGTSQIYLNTRTQNRDSSTDSGLQGWTDKADHSTMYFTQALGVNFLNLADAKITVEGTAYNIAAFSAPYAVTLPTGIMAFYAENSDGSEVTMRAIEGTVAPANTGFVLGNPEDGEVFLLATTDEAPTIESNLLVATSDGPKTFTSTENIYLLANKDAGVGFYRLASTNYPLAANKCYLELQGAVELAVKMVFGGTQTGIEAVEQPAMENDAPIYDLSGRRVLTPAKGGIYVKNGKKIVF